MGLDISFNLEAAVLAGMTIIKEITGTEEEIEAAEILYSLDTANVVEEYLDYLKSEITLGSITNHPYTFSLDVWEATAYVRANTWGSLYEPLTTFLKDNNIAWGES